MMRMLTREQAREEVREQVQAAPRESIREQVSYQPAYTSTTAIASRLAPARAIEAVAWDISYNPRIQQVSLANMVTLSTGNLVQLFLLRALNPSANYSSPLEAELSRLRNNPALNRIISRLAEQMLSPSQANRQSLRQQLRQVYVAVAVGELPPNDDDPNWRHAFTNPNGNGPNSDGNGNGPHGPIIGGGGGSGSGSKGEPGDDLPTSIAKEIALIYYENLELTLDDVTKVLKKFFPNDEALKKLDDQLINQIVHARIDKGRYELKMILPDENIIKAAAESLKGNKDFKVESSPVVLADQGNSKPPVEALKKEEKAPDVKVEPTPSIWKRITKAISSWWNKSKEPLPPYKANISKILDKYICWWKFSWFGHHHDQRAREVKKQILSCQNIDDVKDILRRQETLINPTKAKEVLPPTSWQCKRWNERETLKNPRKAGYAKVIDEALTVIAAPRV